MPPLGNVPAVHAPDALEPDDEALVPAEADDADVPLELAREPDVAVFDVPEPDGEPVVDPLLEPVAVPDVELCEWPPPVDPFDEPEPDEPSDEFGPQPRPKTGTAATTMVKQMRRAD